MAVPAPTEPDSTKRDSTEPDRSEPDPTSTDSAGASPEPAPAAASLHLGDAVRLRQPLPYLKTADPMPMLRPPELVDPGEVGRVVEIRALGLLAVRYRRGTFLINAAALEPLTPPPPG